MLHDRQRIAGGSGINRQMLLRRGCGDQQDSEKYKQADSLSTQAMEDAEISTVSAPGPASSPAHKPSIR
jgi:hypothetical protein